LLKKKQKKKNKNPKKTEKKISNIFKRINYIYTCTCM